LLIILGIGTSGRKSLPLGEVVATFELPSSASEKKALAYETIKGIRTDSNYLYLFNQITSKDLSGTVATSFSYTEMTQMCSELNSQDRREFMTETNPGLLGKHGIDIKNLSSVSRIDRRKYINITEEGDITFALEDSIQVNDSRIGLLIISNNPAKADIQADLEKEFKNLVPRVVRDTIQLHKKMYASLQPAASDDFSVIRAGPDSVKSINRFSRDLITWQWSVTPLKLGKNNLILTVAPIEEDSIHNGELIPTKIIHIKVYAEEKPVKEEILEFIQREWKWLLTSIAAVIGWCVVWNEKRKQKNVKRQLDESEQQTNFKIKQENDETEELTD